MALNNNRSGLMRAFSLILGALCLAGCAGPDIIPIQGSVPPLVHSNEAGVIARAPVAAVSTVPANASAITPDTPQGHYDSMVQHGQMKEANRLGVGVMTGSQPCGNASGVVAPPTPLSKPCGVAPLDDFTLERQRQDY
jgi:hypothetical protein